MRHKLTVPQVEAVDRARQLVLPVAQALQNLLDRFGDEEVGESTTFEAWAQDLSNAARELDDISEALAYEDIKKGVEAEGGTVIKIGEDE